MINRFRNSILLSAIGDALGWITEFENSPAELKNKYGNSQIKSFYNWEKFVGGRFNGFLDKIKAGSYSDDTQLLLSVARSIGPTGKLDNEYFSKIELTAWLKYARGAGRTIKNAAKKIDRKSAKWNTNFFTYKAGKDTIDYRDSGANGAAMRVLPIALANYNDQKMLKENIFSNSIVTHGHPRAIIGALLYGLAIQTLIKINPQNFSYTNFLTALGKDIEENLKLDFLEKPEYRTWVTLWNKKSPENFKTVYDQTVFETLSALRTCYKSLRDDMEVEEALKLFGCYDPKTKGSGISTVIGGIYLMTKFYDQPKNAILSGVNSLGTDTDSIAAFTGGLIGCLYEEDIIPNEWNLVQDHKYLATMAERLYGISQGQPELNHKPNYDSIKTIEWEKLSSDARIIYPSLGAGKVSEIDKQQALTSGKYNLIHTVEFEIGQTCKFSSLLNHE